MATPRSPYNGRIPRTVTNTVLVADGVVRGPALPEQRPEGGAWCPSTTAWYAGLRRSAQAMMFSDQDWQLLLVAAVLHDAVMTRATGRTTAATELRSILSNFGLTPGDRMRLQWVVVDAPVQPTADEARSTLFDSIASAAK